jgi:hypothetical protein
MQRSVIASLAVGVLLGMPSRALADRGSTSAAQGSPALTGAEREALVTGRTVGRPLRFSRAGGSYVGGVAYQVVRATPGEVLRVLADVSALPAALPRTERAELVSSDGRSARIELVQGNAPFVVKYTLHLVQDTNGEGIRFWLDPTRPHDVKDVWGYFRVQPFGQQHTLVTMAVALDLGPGLPRMLFEDRVERAILRAPAKIRAFVEPRAFAAVR